MASPVLEARRIFTKGEGPGGGAKGEFERVSGNRSAEKGDEEGKGDATVEKDEEAEAEIKVSRESLCSEVGDDTLP
jgi:hypothetical protein